MSPPNRNTERLKELMAQHHLSAEDVAKLLDRSVQTVNEWRCRNRNNINDGNLALLEARIAERDRAQETANAV